MLFNPDFSLDTDKEHNIINSYFILDVDNGYDKK